MNPGTSSGPQTLPPLWVQPAKPNLASSLSHGIHSHRRRGRAHRWGDPWRRPRCRTAGRRCGTGCPPAPCSDSPGRRTAAWRVSPGSRSWPLLAQCRYHQSGVASAWEERLAVLTSRAAGSINESEATTRAARAQTLQPAQGRSIRGALLIGDEASGDHKPRRQGQLSHFS